MFHFLLIPLPRTAVKMMDQITWKEFIESLECPKIIKKLESFADHDLSWKCSERNTNYASDEYTCALSKK